MAACHRITVVAARTLGIAVPPEAAEAIRLAVMCVLSTSNVEELCLPRNER